MVTKTQVIDFLSSKEIIQEFSKNWIIHISLFWSFARWEQNLNSDLDLLYDISKNSNATLWTIQELEDILVKKLNVSKVDFVNKNKVNPMLKKYIEKDLIVVF